MTGTDSAVAQGRHHTTCTQSSKAAVPDPTTEGGGHQKRTARTPTSMRLEDAARFPDRPRRARSTASSSTCRATSWMMEYLIERYTYRQHGKVDHEHREITSGTEHVLC